MSGVIKTGENSWATEDGVGHVEREDKSTYIAWRDDIPGVTAEYPILKHAAQYAGFGYSWDGDNV